MVETHIGTMDIMKNHFSLSDWQFDPDTSFRLSSYQYVSPPTALQTGGAGVPQKTSYCLLGIPLAPNVRQGKLLSSFWSWGNGIALLDNVFRVQAPPTNRQPANCYLLHQQQDLMTLFKYIDSVSHTLSTAIYPHPVANGEWRRYRITWEEYGIDAGATGLRITLEHLIDDTWEEVDEYQDPDNNWADSDVNRVGFTALCRNLYYAALIDDTEIWQKA